MQCIAKSLMVICFYVCAIIGQAQEVFWGLHGSADYSLKPTIAVGTGQIAEATQSRLIAYDRNTKNELWRARLNIDIESDFPAQFFWNGLNQADYSGIGDSRVLYDHFANRFIVITMGMDIQRIFFAYSKNSDPLDSSDSQWYKFSVATNYGNTFLFAPNIGINKDFIYVTSCLTLTNGMSHSHGLDVFERPDNSNFDYTNPSHHISQFVPLEIHSDRELSAQQKSPAPAIGIGSNAQQLDVIYLAQVIDLGPFPLIDPIEQFQTVRIVAFWRQSPDQWQNAVWYVNYKNQGTWALVDLYDTLCPGVYGSPAIWTNIQNVIWRDGRLYFAFSVPRYNDSYGARLVSHWCAIDMNNWPLSGEFPFVHEDGYMDGGRIAVPDAPVIDLPDYIAPLDPIVHIGTPYVMPVTNGMALFYSQFNEQDYVDWGWSAKRPNDAYGVLGALPSVMVKGTAGIETAIFNWSNYFSVAMDPLDEFSVWGVGITGRSDGSAAVYPCHNGGVSGSDYCSIIGNYHIPQNGMNKISLYRQNSSPPAFERIQISPPDLMDRMDVVLNQQNQIDARLYPTGQVVTLVAPLGTSGRDFVQWIVNGQIVMDQLLTVTMDEDKEIVLQYR